MGYSCNCGFHTPGNVDDLMGHIRGTHGIEVRSGYSHFAHCNESNCFRQNRHGRKDQKFRRARPDSS